MADAVLGVALDGLTDQLSQVLDNAKNAAVAVELQAAQSAMLAVDHFKSVYADSLQLTIAELQPPIVAGLNQLQGMVADAQRGLANTAAQVTQQAQQIVNTLPFRHGEPQLTSSFTSVLFNPLEARDHQVLFKGNFLNLDSRPHPQHVPTLVFGGQAATLVSSSTNQLCFQVDVDALFPVTAAVDRSRLAVVDGQLSIPWYKDGFIPWLDFLRTLQTSTFQAELCVWSAGPGRIEITVDTRLATTRSRAFSSNNFHLASTREGGNDDHKGERRQVTPTAGWAFDTTKPIRVPFISQVDIEAPHIVSQDANQTTFQFGTIYHRAGSSGSIDCHVEATEQQPANDDQQHTTVWTDLKWGESRPLPLPTDRQVLGWQVQLTALNGSVSAYRGVTQTDPYIRIIQQAYGVIVQAKSIDELLSR